MKKTNSKLGKIEGVIKKEEVELKKEIKQEEKAAVWFFHSHTFRIIIALALFVALIVATLYLTNAESRIYIEKSEINAPVISLSAQSPGIIEKIFVKEGDFIQSNMIVAETDKESIKSKVDGLVIFVQNTPGQIVNSQTPIVNIIEPKELGVIGHIEEDKGLKEIKPNQKVIFTVDAFGSKKYEGIVDSISPTSRQSSIVFSISDKRQEKEFDVKVKFDSDLYPELKNGMSAKMWVYK